ncbi:unnamed protein product [Paramecium sonneborni]|uniref:Uncharacterized protein n=1 Tax=Paramecium sonneborni TaxID=65129 RepID=A0A8S1N709_9CILI|nr:unnamed protein product [Paramecium sonneborni]
MNIEWKLQNIVKALGFFCLFTMPPYAFYWKYSSMKYFEKEIYNDFNRVHSKGKSLADIPKKEKI